MVSISPWTVRPQMDQHTKTIPQFPQHKKYGTALDDVGDKKALDVAWDMWEQRNDIKHNTLHPHKAAAVLDIKVRLRLLYQNSRKGFLPQDRLLFEKSESTLVKGEPTEMLQWIISVIKATRRAAASETNLLASMQIEQDGMANWLHSAAE